MPRPLDVAGPRAEHVAGPAGPGRARSRAARPPRAPPPEPTATITTKSGSRDEPQWRRDASGSIMRDHPAPAPPAAPFPAPMRLRHSALLAAAHVALVAP